MSKPLTSEEKLAISLMLSKGKTSVRKIAKAIDRPKSTVGDYISKLKKVSKTGAETHGARVLLFDVETAPNIAYVWGRWKQNVASSQMIQESFMLTWAAKWLGEDEVMWDSVHLHHKDTSKACDKEIVESLWELIDEADFLVYQNGDRFDLPVFNARAIVHGMQPPHPSKTIDTLKIAKYNFRFSSNRLDDLAVYLGLPIRKIKTDFELWARCLNSDVKAFEEMIEYNIMDVDVLEQVYLKLRPYDRKHPNMALYSPLERISTEIVCGTCSHSPMEPTGKVTTTPVSVFETYRCPACGSVKRTRQNTLPKEVRENILSNIAR